MLPVHLPTKKKSNRSGSVKLFDASSSVQKSVPFHSSRRHGSSRSEITNGNMTNIIQETNAGIGASRPENKAKKQSLFSKAYFQMLQVPSNTDLKKIHAKINKTKQTSKEVSLSTSSLGISQNKSYLIQQDKKGPPNKKPQKSKKKSTNKSKNVEKSKLNKQNLPNKKCQKPHTINKTVQYIKLSQIEPEQTCGSNKKMSRVDDTLEYLANQYLRRQQTQACQQVTKKNLKTVTQKQESPQKLSFAKQTQNIESINKICIKNIIESQLAFKKQIQKNYEQRLNQLRQNNSQLHEQLQQASENYQILSESHNEKLKNIQIKYLQQKSKIQNQSLQYKLKLQAVQGQYGRLKQQKNEIKQKYSTELSNEKKQRQQQRQEFVKKIAITQERQNQLRVELLKTENHNKQLKNQLMKVTSQKQKYERAVKKYQNQISDLEAKLQNQISKNKQQNKDLENLRKQKVQIKQNTELVLEIVRGQMKQIKQSTRIAEKQNFQICQFIKDRQQEVKNIFGKKSANNIKLFQERSF